YSRTFRCSCRPVYAQNPHPRQARFSPSNSGSGWNHAFQARMNREIGHNADELKMKDITSPGWIKFKGILFLIVGFSSAGLLLAEHPSLKVAILLAISMWCFCRFYYFAF